MFAGSFPMSENFSCNGQLLPITEFTALFSIIGTSFGGNGQTTFALPDFRRRCPIGAGSFQDLDPTEQVFYTVGETGGQEMVNLDTLSLPAHDHGKKIQAAIKTGGTATTATAQGSLPADTTNNTVPTALYASAAGPGLMAPMELKLNPTTQISGNSIPHPNMQPYQTTNFLIAISGIFPSRN